MRDVAVASVEAYRSSRDVELRRDARSEVSMVREVAKAIRWLGSPQEPNVIGPNHDIVSESAFRLHGHTYRLALSVHTAVGLPAIVLRHLPGVKLDVPRQTDRFFVGVVDRISRGLLIANWEASDGVYAALGVQVHPTLARAMRSGRNIRDVNGRCPVGMVGCTDRCDLCEIRLSRVARFRYPSGWSL